MKTSLIITAALTAVISTSALANTIPADNAVQQKIEEIEKKYKAEYDRLRAEGEEIAENAPSPNEVEAVIGIETDVDWKVTTMKFDIPVVFIKTREFKLHLPQFRIDRKVIKFDIPETYMATTKVGEYPCFKGWKWHSCDLKMDVPQFSMKRVDVSLDLPVISWDVTSFKMDIPEFYNKRIDWKLHLPQFKVTDVNGELRTVDADVKKLTNRASEISANQKQEITRVIGDDLTSKRGMISKQFDAAINALQKGIEQTRAVGANPENIVADGKTINLVAKLNDLQTQKTKAIADIDKMIANLSLKSA